MAGLDDLAQLFGLPPVREPSPDDWAKVEDYVGSALPGDFKAFLDAYGTGAICGELMVFHPRGVQPATGPDAEDPRNVRPVVAT